MVNLTMHCKEYLRLNFKKQLKMHKKTKFVDLALQFIVHLRLHLSVMLKVHLRAHVKAHLGVHFDNHLQIFETNSIFHVK